MLLFYLLIYFHPFIACFPLELCSHFLFFIYASLRFRFSLASLYQISLALLHQVLLASLRFLPVVLASYTTWRFFLELCFVWKLHHLNFPQNKLWMKKCSFPMISWKLPHKDACCTLYSPVSCKVAPYRLQQVKAARTSVWWHLTPVLNCTSFWILNIHYGLFEIAVVLVILLVIFGFQQMGTI